MAIQGILVGFGDVETKEFVALVGRGNHYLLIENGEVVDQAEDLDGAFGLARKSVQAHAGQDWKQVIKLCTHPTGRAEVTQFGNLSPSNFEYQTRH